MIHSFRGAALALACVGIGAALAASGCSSDENTGGKMPTQQDITNMKAELRRPPENAVIVQTADFNKQLSLVPAPSLPGQMPAKPAAPGAYTLAPNAEHMVATSSVVAQLLQEGRKLMQLHEHPVVTIDTNRGEFRIEVHPEDVPITAANFLALAANHFYDHLTFHRYVAGFVIQGGDPRGDGTGGPGYQIPDEKGPMLHDVGTVAMAKSGPDTAGSQFYVNLGANHDLDGRYTVFGNVVSGMDVVRSLRANDTMNKVTVTGLTIKLTNPSHSAPSDHAA